MSRSPDHAKFCLVLLFDKRCRSTPYSADDRAGVSVELEVRVKVMPPNTTDTEDEGAGQTTGEYSDPEPLLMKVTHIHYYVAMVTTGFVSYTCYIYLRTHVYM